MAFLLFLFWASAFFILYTYLGYPILIALIAKICPNSGAFSEIYPNVTLLISAYNEEKYISDKLDNSLSLDYPREKLQILVVADGSTDKTPEIVKSFSKKGVELLYDPERNGKLAAITRAMQFSRGAIVIFSDANNMYDVKAIRELILPFSDPKVGGATGAKHIIEDGRDLSSAEGLYWKYESAIKKNESMVDSCVSSVGEIFAIRKDAFIPPEGKIILDDLFIILDLLRRGYRVIYVPQARSFEYVSVSAQDEIERRTRNNVGLYQTISLSGNLLPFDRPFLVWQIVSHKYFRVFLPFGFIIMFLTNVAIVIFLNDRYYSSAEVLFIFLLTALSLQITFYFSAIFGNLFNIKGRMGKLLYLPVFLVNSNIAALMGFYNYFTNRRSPIWKRVRR